GDMTEGDAERAQIGARRFPPWARQTRSKRHGSETQEHSRGEQRAIGQARGQGIAPAIAQGIGVIDRKESIVTERLGGGPAAMAKSRGGAEHDRAERPEAVAEIDILEPGGEKPLVEAPDLIERLATDRQGGRGGLLDLEHRFPIGVGIALPAASGIVRKEMVDEEQLARVGGERRK